jgi:hypothetical protein
MTPPPRKAPERLPALSETIRPELNIQKWAIWQPTSSRGTLQARVIEREIPLADGKTFVAKLEVAPVLTLGSLTTDDQRTYYALVKLWEERGSSPSFTSFSLQRLARMLGKRWGKNTRLSLIASLRRLRATAFSWENSFTDGTSKTRLAVLDTFNILADLKIVRREHDGHVTTEAGYFRFHEAILKNLLANYTKPVFFDVVLSFQKEIAQLLYTHLDNVLADKMSFERRTEKLFFEDLGLEGDTYRYASKRREKLEPALKELEGKPLTTGIIVKIALEPTRGGEDLKLVVRKGKAKKSAEALLEPFNVLPFPSVEPKDEQSTEAADLVRCFHRLFHGTEEAQPSGRALDQATGLLARHGARKARHIIGFAHREAPKTRFKAATFGAVMQYEARGIRDFDRQEQAERREREQRQGEEVKRRQEASEAGAAETAFQAFWNSLSEEARKAFQEEAIEQAPSYGLDFSLRRYRQHQDPEAPSAKGYLRAILRRHFEANPLP